MRRLAFLGLFSLSFGCAQAGGYEDAASPHASDKSERQASSRDEWSGSGRRGAGGDSESAALAGDAAHPSAPYEESMGTRWDGDDAKRDAIAAEQRPGLGTAYGETRSSSVDTVSFRRADPNTPDVVFSFHYDDVAGVREVARGHRARAWSDDAMLRQGDLGFALLDAEGRVLSAASVGSEIFAIGEPDARYSLAVANDSNVTYEVVLSVDGLDVIDGRPAAFDKRGYVIDPFTSLVIDGWRTSEDTVAAFRFSSIDDSYAERTGEGRNVGVIGAAFFREAPRHWEEWRAPEDTWRRETADPFPGSR